jgi:hypothetical protein
LAVEAMSDWTHIGRTEDGAELFTAPLEPIPPIVWRTRAWSDNVNIALRTYAQKIKQMRAFELLAELFLVDDSTRNWPSSEEELLTLRKLTRDGLIAILLDWHDLHGIERVNCPACWSKPGLACREVPEYMGATPMSGLPRMYHNERRKRAERKVGWR